MHGNEIVQYLQNYKCHKFDQGHSTKLLQSSTSYIKMENTKRTLLVFKGSWILTYFWHSRIWQNQISHILWIFIKPNVWYSWSLKIFAIKRSFPFIAKVLQGRHFVESGPENFKLLADICFESSLQNTVLPSLLLFLCACY